MYKISEAHVSRREVLAASAGVIALTVLGGCQTDKSDKPVVIKTGIVNIGPATDYPAGTVSTKFLLTYGIAITNESGQVIAINPVCTHKGCMTAWQTDVNQFVCPCHGSHFNILGQPTKGPAKVAMRALPVDAGANGTLSVNLDRLYGQG